MLRGGRRGRYRKPFNGDFTLPGYNYLGPGNSLDKGPPRNKNDATALKHDIAYSKIQARGQNPYISWSNADEDALHEFTFDDYGGAAGKAFFAAKKLAHKTGLIGNVDIPTKKRLRGSNTHIETNEKPVTKKTKLQDGESSSVSNLPPSGNMADGSRDAGSGNEAGLKETPIDDPFMVHRGIPNYTFSSLPYLETKGMNLANNFWSVDHVYRMTSPYDPNVLLTTTDINTGAGTTLATTGMADAGDGSVVQANWFGYYASMYNYYHVLSCRWNVYIENKGTKDIVVHQMYYNDETPPTGATNEDMLLWQGTRTQYLKSPVNAVTNAGRVETLGFNYDTDPNLISNETDTPANAAPNYESGNHVVSRSGHVSCNFSGVYAPGDYTREIRLDSQVENWTAVTANPLLPERLLIRIKPEAPAIQNDANNYGDQLAYKLVVKLEYLVEFKELRAGLRWPTQRNPATVSVSVDYTTGTG